MMSRRGVKSQLTSEPRRDGDALYESVTGLSERSGRHGRVRERRFYADAHTHPASARAALIGVAGVPLVAAARRYVRETQGHRLTRFLRRSVHSSYREGTNSWRELIMSDCFHIRDGCPVRTNAQLPHESAYEPGS